MRIQYIFLFIMAVFFAACHKDIDGDPMITEGVTPGPEVLLEINGTVTGYIYDEDLKPVSGVSVSTYSTEATTDENGVFIFRNTDLDENGTYIRANKAGYIFGSDLIYPKGNESYSAIQLLRLEPTHTFNSSNGGVVEVEGGGSVTFRPNAIANSNGSAYSGEVVVTAKRIATDNPRLADMMPGGLVATDAEGATRVLGTMGMMAVELRTPSGDELNLLSGQTADLRFQVAEDKLATAPEEIELWSFDEVQGLWIEEGVAKLSGSVYEAEVSHFSFWNCDAPFPLIHLCGTVVCDGGQSAPWLSVEISTNNYGTGYGATDSNGEFCGKVPKNEVLTISISSQFCDEVTVIEVGPFTANTVLDDILIEKTGLLLSGTVSCNGDPIESGYIMLDLDGDDISFPYGINQDGSYELSFPNFCGENQTVSAFAVNSETGDASAVLEIELSDAGVTELGFDFNVCSDCNFDGELIFDGSDCENTFASVDITGGSGSFEYQWSTGETTETIIPQAFTLLCVTVTDVDLPDCEVIKCENVPNIIDQWIEPGVTNESCGNGNGSVQLWYDTSGVTTVLVEGPGGYMSTDNPATGLSAGTYTATVTNEFGCMYSQTFEVVNSENISLDIGSSWECGPQTLFIEAFGGSAPYTYSVNGVVISGNEYLALVSGTYCIDVTDVNGCVGTDCLEIIINEEPEYLPTTSCNGFDYEVTFNSATGNQFYIVGNTDSLVFNDGQVWEYDFLNLGFEYTVLVQAEQQCEEVFDIELPNFDGLSATGNQASCETCADGWIDINIDPMGNCFDCMVGQTGVFAISDLDIDLSGENTAQILESGEYVVALFSDSGCLIAFTVIEL